MTEAQAPRTQNVIVVTLDGFRWQEFFGGARDLDGLKARYWRKTPEGTTCGFAAIFLEHDRQGGTDLR